MTPIIFSDYFYNDDLLLGHCMKAPLVNVTPSGLYCPAGDFYIDPWRPVERAVITHAHGDHARAGSQRYICAAEGLPVMRIRLGKDAHYQPLAYGEPLTVNNAVVSLHPAGHILGSAQVRIEVGSEVWVISGDYKRGYDPTCTPFEVVPCDTFITEATFALPIYRWKPSAEVAGDIYYWWQHCRQRQTTALLFCYALGKAQRVLGELAAYTQDTVYLHGAVEVLTQAYREAGIPMVPTLPVSGVERKNPLAGELVLAPPSAYRSVWMKRFKQVETGFASGWMRVRGGRRHKGYDRGFVLSDHADWPDLVRTIRDTQAKEVLVTHGRSDLLVRYLSDQGLNIRPLSGSGYQPPPSDDDIEAKD